jgi:hypothetical protein
MIRLILVAALAFPSSTLAAIFVCSERNDLYQIVGGTRVATAAEAAEKARPGEGVLVLAEGYPSEATVPGEGFWARAKEKGLRVYAEFAADVPGVDAGKIRGTDWERQVITTDVFGARLKRMRILQQQGCHFLPVKRDGAGVWMVVGRVAGYDEAVYGVPKEAWPVLFEMEGGKWLVATTKLSGFVSGRYAPAREWGVIWERILKHVEPGRDWKVVGEPVVRPAYAKGEALPEEVEGQALGRFAEWVEKSRLLVSKKREGEVKKLLASGAEVVETPEEGEAGDGTLGILEGYSSAVRWDGGQVQRLPLRADCNAEIAMAMAMDHAVRGRAASANVARRLLDYVYVTSGMCAGERGDPNSPAYGLIAWGDVAPAWLVANYGDDNARVLLATMLAGAGLESADWDKPLLRGLLANLRTTGRLGFRGDRVDVPALKERGWRAFHDAETVNYAPHFESYLWACYLWGYARTGDREFLDKTKTAIRMTMSAYPTQWRWGDNIERSRMLLPLAWLVRLEDTPEHRGWLMRVANDLLEAQQECGAIQERLRGTGGGHYQIPQTNEAYGTGETPLIQANGDPASDQLYTTGFALLGLHEAAGATGDARLKAAADKLAAFLCRVQVRSERIPYLDGTWFRAFDYGKWDYWASSADLGWGVWSVEAGWGQAWTAAVLGLREKGLTVWEMTAGSKVKDVLEQVKGEMAK